MLILRTRSSLIAGALFSTALCAEPASVNSLDDLTGLTLQDLLNVEIVSVSKFSQKTSDAPSAVTVISADDIRTFGWRTLADVLSSVRGFNITTDHLYSYAGVRGFAPLGDYNDRLLVLIDGMRTNNNVYDQAMLGSEFSLDLDLVERIEIVRGPGSSMYGNNALFGVVNLITRRGQDVGNRIGASANSSRGRGAQASVGGVLDNGGDYLLALSHEDAPGDKLTFSEFAAQGNGNTTTSGTDYLHNTRVFGKFELDGFGVMANLSSRNKGNPAALSSGVFDDPQNRLVDDQGFADIRYKWDAGEATLLSARLFFGMHNYNGYYLSNPAPYTLYRDFGRGRWWGTEFKGDTRLTTEHRLVYGVELQNNTQEHLYAYDVSPYWSYYNVNSTSRRSGLYAQDEWRLTDDLRATVGARFDQVTGVKDQVSPRLALVWHSSPTTTWKGAYGTAFRAPTAYERFVEGQYGVGSALLPETIKTLEFSVEHYFRRDFRLTLLAYDYQMRNQIAANPAYDPFLTNSYLINLGHIEGRGLEIEAEKLWDGGARLRASLDLPYIRDDTGQWPINSPKWNFKLNHAQPLIERWKLGLEAQVVGPQRTNLGQIGTSPIINVTLSRPMKVSGWEFIASVHDLFNRQPRQPILDDSSGLARDTVPAEPRSLGLKVLYRF